MTCTAARIPSYSTQIWLENMNPSAHHKLKQSQVDFQKKANISWGLLWDKHLVLSVCSITKRCRSYTINNHTSTLMKHRLRIHLQPKKITTFHYYGLKDFLHGNKQRLYVKQSVQPNESKASNELSYAIHSLNNLPACVIQWLCWMYSTFKKKRRNRQNEFLLFFSPGYFAKRYTKNKKITIM